MKAVALSDKIQQLKQGTRIVITLPSGVISSLIISVIRRHGMDYLFSFEGVSTRTEAEDLRGSVIALSRDEIQMAEGEYWEDEIIGMGVCTSEGTLLGTVTGIMSTGSNDVYVVASEGRELLIPAIREVIQKIDTSSRLMTITPLEGMLD